jgi:hypothetical protein
MVAQPEGAKSYFSLVDAVRKLHGEGGLRAFYKGLCCYLGMLFILVQVTRNLDLAKTVNTCLHSFTGTVKKKQTNFFSVPVP